MIDFYNALQLLIPDQFQVTFSAAQEIDRQYYRVPHHFDFSADILSHNVRVRGKDLHRNPGLWSALKKTPASTVIVSGNYFMPDARTARMFCTRDRARFVFWGEHPFKKQEARWRRQLKSMYLRWFLRPASAVIGIGQEATDTYQRLSRQVSGTSIPYAPDLSSLLKPSKFLISQANKLRSQIVGERSSLILLYAGSLIPRKDPLTLLRAFSSLVREHNHVFLLIVGEGPLDSDLRRLVIRHDLQNHVEFAGFLSGRPLLAAYLASDIFVLPTKGHEGWGVVVQEAMAAGLPVVVSENVGAGKDLVSSGRNGSVFTPGSVSDLTDCLRNLVANRQQRLDFGRHARLVAADTSAPNGAQNFLDFMAGIDGVSVR